MLTATYSLIAISNEQSATQSILRKVQQSIQSLRRNLQQIDLPALDAVLEQVTRFDLLCHARKVERYLIPAIKAVTHAADGLLAELDMLSTSASKLLRSAGDVLGRRTADREQLMETHSSLELYCHKMSIRLAREESELFPIAQSVLSVEEWFAVAEHFLSEDERTLTRRRRAPHFVVTQASPNRFGMH
jgi:hemerythrin-like domain-containing protein